MPTSTAALKAMVLKGSRESGPALRRCSQIDLPKRPFLDKPYVETKSLAMTRNSAFALCVVHGADQVEAYMSFDAPGASCLDFLLSTCAQAVCTLVSYEVSSGSLPLLRGHVHCLSDS